MGGRVGGWPGASASRGQSRTPKHAAGAAVGAHFHSASTTSVHTRKVRPTEYQPGQPRSPLWGAGGPRAACAHELHTQEGSVQVARVGRPVSPGQPRAPSLPCVWPVSSPGPKPSSGRSSEAGLVGQFPRPRGQGPPYPTLGLRSSQRTGQGIDCLSSPNLLGYFWAGGGWDDSRTFRGWIPATKILSKSRKTSTRGGVSSGPKPSWPAQRWGLVCICKGTRGCLSGQCCLPPPSPGMRTGSLIEDGHNQMVTPDPKACGGPQVIADQSEGSQ